MVRVRRIILSYGRRYVCIPFISQWLIIDLILEKDHAKAFPIISYMACDFLAILAISVSIEHLFSKSYHVCANMHSSLKAMTISQLILYQQNYSQASEPQMLLDA